MVRIPTRFCINLAVAGAVVMYDRMLCHGRFADAAGARGRPAAALAMRNGARLRARARRDCGAAIARPRAAGMVRPAPAPYQRQRGRCDRSSRRSWRSASWPPSRAPARAAAQTPKFVSTHRDWTLYEVDGDKGRVCYVASEPTKQEGNYKKRGNPAVLVARLPGEPPTEQVSVQPGYTFKKGSEVELAVGKQKFTLFTQGEHAWARTDADDKSLIGAMRKGDSMVIKGTSSRDTNSTGHLFPRRLRARLRRDARGLREREDGRRQCWRQR